MKSRYLAGARWTACAVLVCLCWAPAFANSVPFITGTSTAEQIMESSDPYYLWYRYDITITWDLDGEGAGLSHWNLILKDGCGLPDHLIEFDTPASGFSTSVDSPDDPEAMGWTGYFLPDGDTSLNPDVTDPVVKYNDPHDPSGDPGPEGSGTFWFYANIIPEYGTYPNALVAKAGTIDDTYGDLTGAYPSCTIIPEPLTMLGVFAGVAWIGAYIRKGRAAA